MQSMQGERKKLLAYKNMDWHDKIDVSTIVIAKESLKPFFFNYGKNISASRFFN